MRNLQKKPQYNISKFQPLIFGQHPPPSPLLFPVKVFRTLRFHHSHQFLISRDPALFELWGGLTLYMVPIGTLSPYYLTYFPYKRAPILRVSTIQPRLHRSH